MKNKGRRTAGRLRINGTPDRLDIVKAPTNDYDCATASPVRELAPSQTAVRANPRSTESTPRVRRP